MHHANVLTGIDGLIAAIGISIVLVGCTSSALTTARMGPNTVAKQLGFPGCRVSIPLSQSEVIEDAKAIGNPRPEEDPEWVAITKNAQPGDELRVVDCLKAGRSSRASGTYFYVLIRNNQIIRKFYVGMFD
jgi:hypothetical protein